MRFKRIIKHMQTCSICISSGQKILIKIRMIFMWWVSLNGTLKFKEFCEEIMTEINKTHKDMLKI